MLLQVSSLLHQLQIGLMDTLLERSAVICFLKLQRTIQSAFLFICISRSPSHKFFDVFQMNLGSAFGAFLDPVADKVCYLLQCVHVSFVRSIYCFSFDCHSY